MADFTFTVDEDSSEKGAQEALSDLRRMARYGRIDRKSVV